MAGEPTGQNPRCLKVAGFEVITCGGVWLITDTRPRRSPGRCAVFARSRRPPHYATLRPPDETGHPQHRGADFGLTCATPRKPRRCRSPSLPAPLAQGPHQHKGQAPAPHNRWRADDQPPRRRLNSRTGSIRRRETARQPTLAAATMASSVVTSMPFTARFSVVSDRLLQLLGLHTSNAMIFCDLIASP